jgi:hypothetical protein
MYVQRPFSVRRTDAAQTTRRARRRIPPPNPAASSPRAAAQTGPTAEACPARRPNPRRRTSIPDSRLESPHYTPGRINYVISIQTSTNSAIVADIRHIAARHRFTIGLPGPPGGRFIYFHSIYSLIVIIRPIFPNRPL